MTQPTYFAETQAIALELGDLFNWYGLKSPNRLRLLSKRQQVNQLNYSAAYGALIAASVNADKKWKISDFLPYPGVWDYFTSPPLNISPEVARLILSTYEDAPNGACLAIEQIQGQLVTLAGLA